ncbi:MAG: hypothetical protein C0511_03125 [Hyphomicrobium sp.]|nr:hypothetical protein [Hyphomicrobium sp.]PPC83325.1 MAG: hypothetical protein CTY40_02585 [Hyphomicrobium sp.]
MAWDDLGRQAQDENRKDRDRLIGVYIGVLAVMLAVCGMGGGNASKDATLKNIEASNTWSFFQAKNMRRHVLRTQTEELELWLLKEPQIPEAGKAAVEAKIKSYKQQIELLTSDEKGNEGLDQLFKKGKALEAERDLAMTRDPYFDYGQALLQIAIVLASVALISSGSLLLVGSALVGITGTLLTLNGFMLFVRIPFIG